MARRDVSRTLVLTGRVRPLARPRIGSSVAGTVREVPVREGEHVDRGQLLLRLDDAPQRAALAQARATLASAQGNARANVEVTELAAQGARRDAERARTLYAEGAISLRDREEAERLAAKTAAELEAAVTRAGGAARPALAEVMRARAAVEAAEAQLALTRVTARRAGDRARAQRGTRRRRPARSGVARAGAGRRHRARGVHARGEPRGTGGRMRAPWPRPMPFPTVRSRHM